ncbi:unnamed protein product [Camellia sinensis]
MHFMYSFVFSELCGSDETFLCNLKREILLHTPRKECPTCLSYDIILVMIDKKCEHEGKSRWHDIILVVTDKREYTREYFT